MVNMPQKIHYELTLGRLVHAVAPVGAKARSSEHHSPQIPDEPFLYHDLPKSNAHPGQGRGYVSCVDTTGRYRGVLCCVLCMKYEIGCREKEVGVQFKNGIAKGTAMMKVVGGVAAMLLVAAGVVLAQDAKEPPPSPFVVGKETTVISGPLHEDGTPDYVTAINERQSKGVTSENNAFVAWLEVAGTDNISEKIREQMLKMCGAKEGPSQWTKLVENATRDDLSKAAKQVWDANDFPLVAEWLEKNDTALDKTKEAFSRGKY